MSNIIQVKIFPMNKEDILEFLESKNIKVNEYFIKYINHEKYESIFDNSEVRVIITTVKEMGFNQAANHEEIKERGLELGYQLAEPYLGFYLRMALLNQVNSKNNILSQKKAPVDKNLYNYDINLASFSVLSMPIKSNSLDVVTSFIGLSSTREGEQGKIKSANEVYRILKNDGYFIAVENEWVDFKPIYEVLKIGVSQYGVE